MIRAWNDSIIVALPRAQERTLSSGLWIPPSVQEPAPEGVVVSIGPKARKFCDLHDVSEGSRVFFEQYAGLEVKDRESNRIFLVLQPQDIKAKIDD